MASFTTRERTTHHVEYLVPRGDVVGEFQKAYTVAYAAWRHATGYDPSGRAVPPDDWAQVDADDEYLVIRFEVTRTRDGGEPQ